MTAGKSILFFVGVVFLGWIGLSQASLEQTAVGLKNKVAQVKRHQLTPPKKPGFEQSTFKNRRSLGRQPLPIPPKPLINVSKASRPSRKVHPDSGLDKRKNLSAPSVERQQKDLLGNDLMKTLEIWESLRDPDAKMSFEDRVAFMETIPDWPINLVKKRAEQSLREGTDIRTIDRWFLKNPPLTGIGCFYYAQGLKVQAAKDPMKQKVLTDFVKKTWQSVDFEEVVLEEKFWKAFRTILQEEDHRERISYLLYEKKHEPVARMKNFLTGSLRTIIDVRLAFARDFKNVERLYKSLSLSLKKLPEFMHDHIRWLRLQGRADETHSFLKTKIESTSLSQSIWPDRCEIVRDLIRDKAHGKSVYDCLRAHNIRQGGSFSDGEFLSGFVALHLLNDPQTALGHFNHLYDNVSTSISKPVRLTGPVGLMRLWEGR